MLPKMILKKYKEFVSSIPLNVRKFFFKAVILFVIWKLLYIFLLMPAGIPNNFLTNSTALGTAKFLSAFTSTKAYPHYTTKSAFVYNEKKEAVGIGHSCNALEVYILYIGFILCIPSSYLRQLLYILIGISLIYLSNLLRCAGLFYLVTDHSPFFHVAHKYVFKFVLYALVFLLWYFYTKPKKALVSA